MSKTLTVILTHQPEACVAAMCRWWTVTGGAGDILVAYGGKQSAFDALSWQPRVFVGDPRLRTRDHQRERQSFSGVFASVSVWLEAHADYSHVLFTEFDCVPLVTDVNTRLLQRMEAEQADVLACRLGRVDGTNHPHLLSHRWSPAFTDWLSSFSVRKEKAVVLTMLGSFSFWNIAAFHAVASKPEPEPFYLELVIPTVAHHCGYRVRNLADQSPFVLPVGDWKGRTEAVRQQGGWMVHPVKGIWEAVANGEPISTFIKTG